VAAALGALMTTWATFAPSFLWIFAGAPHMEQLRANKRLAAALSAITAVVVGVMSYLAAWFGLHLLFGESGWGALGPLRWPTVATLSKTWASSLPATSWVLQQVSVSNCRSRLAKRASRCSTSQTRVQLVQPRFVP
jgi:chromate transporter